MVDGHEYLLVLAWGIASKCNIFLGIYALTEYYLYVEEGTADKHRKDLTLELIAFYVQAFSFVVIFGGFVIYITLSTTNNSNDRSTWYFFAFFMVLPLAYIYFYVKNIFLINMIFEESQLPESKSSSVGLTIVHYIFVLLALLTFLVFAAMGIYVGYLLYNLSLDAFSSLC
mmetsp:Transcript_41544/g.54705  ORF Transcript_41544/g.54705 Transcript_41544/m.54705 type:complete len:171 (-) Transcript_41544:194-706(-)